MKFAGEKVKKLEAQRKLEVENKKKQEALDKARKHAAAIQKQKNDIKTAIKNNEVKAAQQAKERASQIKQTENIKKENEAKEKLERAKL